MKRKCEECPAEVQAVCRHAFGKFWNDKSSGGEGCDFPLDGVAEAWREAGWTPDAPGCAKTALETKSTPRGILTLATARHAMAAPFRASGATLPKMPRRPVRKPPVSPETMRQAELFFGRMK